MKVNVAAMVLILFSGVSPARGFMMSPPQAPSPFLIGHEEITREGVDIANQLMNEEFYPMPGFMVPGVKSSNPLVIGNFLTDFPDNQDVEGPDLRGFYGIARSADWHTHENTQSTHALRDYDTVIDLKKSCRRVQKKIVIVSKRALSRFLDGRRARAFNYMGHATHIVQDSFSPAHIKRATQFDGIGTSNVIKDICVYGRAMKGQAELLKICYHSTVDHKDYIWTSVPDRDLVDSLDPDGSNIGHMAREGRSAAYATALYLRTMAETIKKAKRLDDKAWSMKLLEAELKTLFEDGPVNVRRGLHEMFPRGILNCSDFYE